MSICDSETLVEVLVLQPSILRRRRPPPAFLFKGSWGANLGIILGYYKGLPVVGQVQQSAS